MEIRTGANLGRYQLLAEIGRGAMGTVYQALDPEIDRLVAIKTFSSIDPGSREADSFRERFVQEARAAGRLAHPGIVAIYDRGEEPETRIPYIVMEYVPGQPLSTLLASAEGRLDRSQALQIAKEIAEALAYAHEKGVVHRDIKPSNILITEEGNAKIADFGVARLDSGDVTLHGQILGTPAYMSPEQLTGGAIDGRSDLFSLGVILYTMLMGFRPFQGNGASTITFKVVNRQPVSLTSFHLDLSKDSEYVVARAMAKDPAHRYQTGTEFAQDLQDLLAKRELRSRRTASLPPEEEVVAAQSDYRPFLKSVASLAEPPTRGSRTSPFYAYSAMSATATSATVAATAPDKAGEGDRNWSVARPAIALALVGMAVIAAAGYIGHERNMLRKADAEMTLPTAPPEQIAQPAIGADSSEPVVEVALPAATRPVSPDADADFDDVTVVHTRAAVAPTKSAPPSPTRMAAATPPAIAAKTSAGPTATLQFALQHHFLEAQVWVWVDDQLAYSGTAHGAKRRLFLLPGGIEGRESHEIRLPSGGHDIKVRVTSKEGQYDESGSIHSTFLPSRRNVLVIRCNKGSIELKLNSGS